MLGCGGAASLVLGVRARAVLEIDYYYWVAATWIGKMQLLQVNVVCSALLDGSSCNMKAVHAMMQCIGVRLEVVTFLGNFCWHAHLGCCGLRTAGNRLLQLLLLLLLLLGSHTGRQCSNVLIVSVTG
jgi:hypothetical protein